MRLAIGDDSDRVRVIRHLVGAGYRVYLDEELAALDRWDLGDIRLAADRFAADVAICAALDPANGPGQELGLGVALDEGGSPGSEDAIVLLAEIGWVMREPAGGRSRLPIRVRRPSYA